MGRPSDGSVGSGLLLTAKTGGKPGFSDQGIWRHLKESGGNSHRVGGADWADPTPIASLQGFCLMFLLPFRQGIPHYLPGDFPN